MSNILISINEAAELHGIKKREIYKLINDGKLSLVKHENQKYLYLNEVKKLKTKKNQKNVINKILHLLKRFFLIWLIPTICALGVLLQCHVTRPYVLIDKVVTGNNPNPLSHEFVLINAGDTEASRVEIVLYNVYFISQTGAIFIPYKGDLDKGERVNFSYKSGASGATLAPGRTISFFFKEHWPMLKQPPKLAIIPFEFTYRDFLYITHTTSEFYKFFIENNKPVWRKVGTYHRKLTEEQINKEANRLIQSNQKTRNP